MLGWHFRPDILLIEPFLEDRDGILWIKELAKEFPDTRVLIVASIGTLLCRTGRCTPKPQVI